eukprot:m.71770 g.71770  ORF g.71770 m.71770 type:complete len:84 (-) comp12276_c0_seq1:17-268(-)
MLVMLLFSFHTNLLSIPPTKYNWDADLNSYVDKCPLLEYVTVELVTRANNEATVLLLLLLRLLLLLLIVVVVMMLSFVVHMVF